jgi:hypothetical protein
VKQEKPPGKTINSQWRPLLFDFLYKNNVIVNNNLTQFMNGNIDYQTALEASVIELYNEGIKNAEELVNLRKAVNLGISIV